MTGDTRRYERLQHEDVDPHVKEDRPGDPSAPNHSIASERLRLRKLCSLNLVVLFALLCSLGLSLFVKRAPSQGDCASVVSPHSPFLEDLDFWEGELHYPRKGRSKYAGPPTLELEQAWEDLTLHPGVGLRQSDLARLNKTDYENYIQVTGSTPDDPVYGAILEVFHQLHCLNLIRRATWPLDKFSDSWGDLYPSGSSATRRMHTDHCIEALRLALMCYADVTPLVTKYSDELGMDIVADFDVPHKCRNFEKLSKLVDAQGESS